MSTQVFIEGCLSGHAHNHLDINFLQAACFINVLDGFICLAKLRALRLSFYHVFDVSIV